MSGKWNQFVLVIVNQKHENCIHFFITFTLQNNCYLDIVCVCVFCQLDAISLNSS